MTWDARFLRLAEHIAGWSKDPSTKVGAAIVRPDKTIASVGFNGFPRGVSDDTRLDDREFKLGIVVHAELNALLHAREPLAGCTLYVWPCQPCSGCAAAIIQAGITRVVAPIADVATAERWRESFERSALILSEAKVQLDLLTGALSRPA